MAQSGPFDYESHDLNLNLKVRFANIFFVDEANQGILEANSFTLQRSAVEKLPNNFAHKAFFKLFISESQIFIWDWNFGHEEFCHLCIVCL